MGILETFHLVYSNNCKRMTGTADSFSLKASTDLEFYIPRKKKKKKGIALSLYCVVYKSVFYFSFLFLCFVLCLQGRKVHSHWPLPSLRPAGGELPCQAPLPAEEPVQAAHGSQSPASPDWHSVREREIEREKLGGRFPCCITQLQPWLFSLPSCRSDKLRWISSLSRPHPEIDFSAAQGKDLLILFAINCLKSFIHNTVFSSRVYFIK